MATVDFPSFLRPMIKASKSREQAAAFRQSNPFSGEPYIESLTDDTPVIYDCQFKFGGRDKSVFWQWFNDPDYCDKGRAAFNMPISVEGGDMVMQECRFLANGTPQLISEDAGVFTYSARIIVRQLQDPDNGYAAELIALGELGGDIEQTLYLLDLGINITAPEA